MRNWERKELKLEVSGVEVLVEYDYSPEYGGSYDQPPDPAEVYLISVDVGGVDLKKYPTILKGFEDDIIQDIFNYEL